MGSLETTEQLSSLMQGDAILELAARQELTFVGVFLVFTVAITLSRLVASASPFASSPSPAPSVPASARSSWIRRLQWMYCGVVLGLLVGWQLFLELSPVSPGWAQRHAEIVLRARNELGMPAVPVQSLTRAEALTLKFNLDARRPAVLAKAPEAETSGWVVLFPANETDSRRSQWLEQLPALR